MKILLMGRKENQDRMQQKYSNKSVPVCFQCFVGKIFVRKMENKSGKISGKLVQKPHNLGLKEGKAHKT